MNFLKGSLFRRNTEPEELEPMEESGGGILAVWGSPGCGKTVTAVKIAKHLAAQKKNTVLLLCDMTAPMMPCICPPSELEVDAQYWGVAQRRKRIFLVADFAGRTADKILFIPESMFGDPTPSF